MSVQRHELHLLTGSYALDALTDDEQSDFEKHLARCPSCAEEVRGCGRPPPGWRWRPRSPRRRRCAHWCSPPPGAPGSFHRRAVTCWPGPGAGRAAAPLAVPGGSYHGRPGAGGRRRVPARYPDLDEPAAPAGEDERQRHRRRARRAGRAHRVGARHRRGHGHRRHVPARPRGRRHHGGRPVAAAGEGLPALDHNLIGRGQVGRPAHGHQLRLDAARSRLRRPARRPTRDHRGAGL